VTAPGDEPHIVQNEEDGFPKSGQLVNITEAQKTMQYPMDINDIRFLNQLHPGNICTENRVIKHSKFLNSFANQ
jgi:hypothetical protein